MPNSVNNNYYGSYGTSKAAQAKNGEFWYEDPNKNNVSMDSFLQLMIAQLKNQDFQNTLDETQFITQMAQFSTLQAMNELASYSKNNYAATILGHEVAYKVGVGSQTEYKFGVVDAVSTKPSGEPILYIGNAEYKLSDIVQVYPKESDNIKDLIDGLGDKIVEGIDEIINGKNPPEDDKNPEDDENKGNEGDKVPSEE